MIIKSILFAMSLMVPTFSFAQESSQTIDRVVGIALLPTVRGGPSTNILVNCGYIASRILPDQLAVLDSRGRMQDQFLGSRSFYLPLNSATMPRVIGRNGGVNRAILGRLCPEPSPGSSDAPFDRTPQTTRAVLAQLGLTGVIPGDTVHIGQTAGTPNWVAIDVGRQPSGNAARCSQTNFTSGQITWQNGAIEGMGRGGWPARMSAADYGMEPNTRTLCNLWARRIMLKNLASCLFSAIGNDNSDIPANNMCARLFSVSSRDQDFQNAIALRIRNNYCGNRSSGDVPAYSATPERIARVFAVGSLPGINQQRLVALVQNGITAGLAACNQAQPRLTNNSNITFDCDKTWEYEAATALEGNTCPTDYFCNTHCPAVKSWRKNFYHRCNRTGNLRRSESSGVLDFRIHNARVVACRCQLLKSQNGRGSIEHSNASNWGGALRNGDTCGRYTYVAHPHSSAAQNRGNQDANRDEIVPVGTSAEDRD